MGDENHICTLGDYYKSSHEGYRNTIELLVGNNVVPLRSDTIRLMQNGCLFHGLRSENLNQHLKDYLKLVDSPDLKLAHARTIDKSVGGKLCNQNAEESWALLEDLALYDNESWNDPRDFAKPVKAIALPQDVPMNKITTSCEIYSGSHDTQYCMEDPEQSFVEYASSRTDEARGKWYTFKREQNNLSDTYNPSWRSHLNLSFYNQSNLEGLVSNFMASQDARLSKFEADFKQQQSDMTNKIDTVLKAITDRIAGTLPSDTDKNQKLSTYLVLCARSYPSEDLQCSTQTHEEDGDVMFIEIIPKDDDSHNEKPEAEGQKVEYFDIFPTRSELAYLKYLICGPIPSIFLQNPIIMEGCPSNLKIPCNIGHVHVEKSYIDLNSPLNIMTRMMYNWIMRRKLHPRENANGGVSNFTGRIKGMHIFVGNFTYIMNFMIIEDISSIIDPRLSQVMLGKPFMEISNLTHDPPEGVVRFTNENNEVAYKMPHNIEQYDSLSDLKKEQTKSVYLRNEEDKKRGVEYVMSKILGFYKECLKLGLGYLIGMDDEGEVT
ncbi:hypothetical protein Tco_0488247 [Tanacetum coccineum]